MVSDYAKFKAHTFLLGGFCKYETDGENYLQKFYFATVNQKNLTTYFLDNVGFDGTCKINNDNLFL